MARRREMTACPSAVFMRVRKPCVLARRRLFGWKVRFGIVFYLVLSFGDEIGNIDYTTGWMGGLAGLSGVRLFRGLGQQESPEPSGRDPGLCHPRYVDSRNKP